MLMYTESYTVIMSNYDNYLVSNAKKKINQSPLKLTNRKVKYCNNNQLLTFIKRLVHQLLIFIKRLVQGEFS